MYTIQQFARLADVTVKALRHYERVNLLVPARTAARHRRYTVADLSRLDRVLALRTLGLPLAAIRAVLAGDLQRLPARLATLEDLRARLDRAIAALRTIGQHARPPEALDAFVHESVWMRWERLRQARASQARRAPDRVGASRLALFRAIDTALAADPDGPRRPAPDPAVARNHGARDPRGAAPPGGLALGDAGYIASLYDTTPEVWERVVAFVEARAESAMAPESQTDR